MRSVFEIGIMRKERGGRAGGGEFFWGERMSIFARKTRGDVGGRVLRCWGKAFKVTARAGN